jgi:hypothetical protein
VLASHTSGFGNKMGTLNSALVGGRMTKQSKAALKEAGLLDENGHIVDEAGLQANAFDWTQTRMKPIFEAKGVKFNEHMSEEDKRTVSGDVTRMFSAKNAADAIISFMLDASLVEKARHRKTEDIESADDTQHKDAGTAWAGVKTQLGDFGTELVSTSAAISMMSQAASDFAKYTSWVRDTDKKLSDWWHGDKGPPSYGPDFGAGAQPVPFGEPAFDFSSAPTSNLEQARRTLFGNPVIRTTAPELTPTMTFGTGVATQPAQPLEGANVQATLNGTAEVTGQVTQTIKIEPSPLFNAAFSRLEAVIGLIGKLTANGPGSTGSSSPDAVPQRRMSTGDPFAGY